MNTSLFLFGVVLFILYYILPNFGRSYMFKKGGEVSWKAYVPFYNYWVYLTLLCYPTWLKVLLMLSGVSFLAGILSFFWYFSIDMISIAIGIGSLLSEMILTAFTYMRFLNFFNVSPRNNEMIIASPFIYYPWVCMRKDFYKPLKSGIFWEKNEK